MVVCVCVCVCDNTQEDIICNKNIGMKNKMMQYGMDQNHHEKEEELVGKMSEEIYPHGMDNLMILTVDVPEYCNKNIVTPKATNLTYQPGVCTNVRGVNTICASYNLYFFH